MNKLQFYTWMNVWKTYSISTLKIYGILECLKGFIYAKEIL